MGGCPHIVYYLFILKVFILLRQQTIYGIIYFDVSDELMLVCMNIRGEGKVTYEYFCSWKSICTTL